MTFNQYIKLFVDIANSHNDVRGFGNGPIHEYLDTNNEGLGQQLWVDIENSEINGGIRKDKFNLYIMDAVNKDVSNRNDILSDTKRTLEDIISILNNPYYYDFFQIEESITLQEFYDEKFSDEFCGWYCTISLNIDFTYNSCEANISGIPLTGTTAEVLTGIMDDVINGNELVFIDDFF